MANPVQEFYGNRLRVRACGICMRNDQLLLVNHRGVATDDFWAPPGGGAEFGEPLTECVRREFEEETGLIVQPKGLLFTTEFIRPPLHAIEVFFHVEIAGGTLTRGTDPELNLPVIKDVRFVSWAWLKLQPLSTLHGIFQKLNEPSDIMRLSGYFKLE